MTEISWEEPPAHKFFENGNVVLQLTIKSPPNDSPREVAFVWEVGINLGDGWRYFYCDHLTAPELVECLTLLIEGWSYE